MTRTTGEQNDMADKLIRDGSEGRWMRMSLAMSIVGAVLIVVAAVLAVVAENSVSYVERERHATRGLLAGARELCVCGGRRAGGSQRTLSHSCDVESA